MDRKLAKEFQRMRVRIDEPRPAFAMYIAVWAAPGRAECVIGAPSLQVLNDRWRQITRTELDERRAQRVLVMLNELPESLAE